MRLELEHVGYTYSPGTSFSVRALQEVTVAVESGELLLVLGATGSGKSTLLRIAAGLMAPATGRVTIDGETVRGSADVAGRTGLVFQSPQNQLFADTVITDVAFGPRNFGASEAEAHAAAEEALALVGLDPQRFGPRSPFRLSGGEAHRVAIAGVLAMRPDFLLFDEPTAGLDAYGREAVLDIVAGTRGRAGVVVVTHDAEDFLGVADRVLVLADGRCTYVGAPGGLIADTTHFEAACLRVPEVLRAQVLAAQAGLELAERSVDPGRAAVLIAEAIGRAG